VGVAAHFGSPKALLRRDVVDLQRKKEVGVEKGSAGAVRPIVFKVPVKYRREEFGSEGGKVAEGQDELGNPKPSRSRVNAHVVCTRANTHTSAKATTEASDSKASMSSPHSTPA